MKYLPAVDVGLKYAKLLWTKRWLIVFDTALLAGAFVWSYLLRFEFAIPAREMPAMWSQLIFVTLVQSVALIVSGAHAFIWRYIGVAEIKTFAIASAIATIPLLIARLAFPQDGRPWSAPLSVLLADVVFGFAGLLAARILRRIAYENLSRRAQVRVASELKNVLLIGAGRAGRSMVSEIQSGREDALCVRGFVDDDPAKRHMVVHGVSVVGSTEDLQLLVRELDIDFVVITMVRASRRELRRIMEICDRIPVKVKIVPSFWELIHDRSGVSHIRDFDIDDLLGREPVITLAGDAVRVALQGKTVMVTGAGGSIGCELVRQIAHCSPGRLLLLERAEPALYNIHSELKQKFPDVCTVPLLADVASQARMADVFDRYRPQVILHAAAHKHVPMLEVNVCDAIANNVLGTQVVAELAGEYNAEVMVLISSDKAVRPKSILGATKRVAELVMQDLDREYDCRYLAVRFGNVIGSAGSVIPLFREQIRKGGPVTVTHPEMTRYFMTIPEAAQLVLEAMTMGHGSEIFTLDMGEPVRILSLARDVISLCGLRPDEDIDIVFTGPLPGEKITEELDLEDESVSRTRHPKIFVGRIAYTYSGRLSSGLAELKRLAHAGESIALRALLGQIVPESSLQPETVYSDDRKAAAMAAR